MLQETDTFFLGGLVVDGERIKQVGDFPWLGPVHPFLQ